MDIIILKDYHMEKFSHMIPPTMIPTLKQNNIFSLGLLEKKEDQFHPAGILITQIEEDMAELLWIYVSPQMRNQGAGYQLLHSTIEILKLEKHIKTLMVFLEPDSSYLYYFLFFGFDPDLSHPGKLYETSINGLANGKLGNAPLLPNIVSFHDLTPLSLKRFNALMGTKKLTSDMIAFPLEKEDYLPCSMAIVESGDITDLLLFAEDEDNTGISLVYHHFSTPNAQRTISLVSASISFMKQNYPGETKVRLLSMNKLSQLIADTCTSPLEESSLFLLTYKI